MKALVFSAIGVVLDGVTLLLTGLAAGPMWIAIRTNRWAKDSYRAARS